MSSFDHMSFENALAKVLTDGVRIESLDKLMHEYPNWQKRLHKLESTLHRDVPEMDNAYEAPSLEDFQKQTLHAPTFDAKGQWIAVLDNQWIGLSQLLIPHPSDPKRATTGLTGVLPQFRRRKIATALKVRSLAIAKARGIQSVLTGNEEENPMLQLNLALGFEPKPAVVMFKRILEPALIGAA